MTLKLATIPQGQGRLRLNSQTMCHLPLANVATKIRLNNQEIFGESAENAISDPTNGRHFLRSRSFEIKFTDKDARTLTPSNVPKKFR